MVRYGTVLNAADGYLDFDPTVRAGDVQLRVFPDAANGQPFAIANVTHTIVHQMGQEMVPIGTKQACDSVNETKVSSPPISATTSFPPSAFDSAKQLQFRFCVCVSLYVCVCASVCGFAAGTVFVWFLWRRKTVRFLLLSLSCFPMSPALLLFFIAPQINPHDSYTFAIEGNGTVVVHPYD